MRTPHSRSRQSGYTLIEALITLAVIGVVAGIAFPLILNQRDNATETAERAALLDVSTKIEALLTDWRGLPPAQVAITTTDGTWTITPSGSPAAATGTVGSDITITGTVWTDGSYCLAASTPSADGFIYRSDSSDFTKNGTCPTAAFGGVGTMPDASNIDLPASVTGLAASSPASNALSLTWSPVAGATGYTVKISGFAPVNVASNSAYLTGVPAGAVQITVYARNGHGAGAGATALVAVGGANSTNLATLVDTLAASNTALQQEVASLRAEVDALKSPTPTPTSTP